MFSRLGQVDMVRNEKPAVLILDKRRAISINVLQTTPTTYAGAHISPTHISSKKWLGPEVCSNVSVEPHLQPVTGEILGGASANTEDGARLDVAADGFWGGRYDVSTLMPRPTNSSAWLLPTGGTNGRRCVPMSSGFEK